MLVNKKNFLYAAIFAYQVSVFANEVENNSTVSCEQAACDDVVPYKNTVEASTQDSVSLQQDDVVNHAMPQYRDLTAEEMDNFKKSLTEDDFLVLKNFIQTFQDGFSKFQDVEQIQKLEEICKKYGVSLRVMIQLIPTVLVANTQELSDVAGDDVVALS
jgi:hypothetical protein